MRVIGVGDTVFWARIHHETGIYEVLELKVRTVYPSLFIGCDNQSKRAYPIYYEDCDVTVFDNRTDAARLVREAEKDKKNFTIDQSED